jgi:hypothetical protein
MKPTASWRTCPNAWIGWEAKPGHGPKLTPAEQLETNTPSLADKLKEAQRPDDFVPVDPDPRD